MTNKRNRPDDDERHFHSDQPDAFDRAYGQVEGFPHTKPTTITIAGPLGVGGVRSYIVQTFRTPELGDTCFVQITGPEGLQRVHLPPKVTDAIARQRDALTASTRSATGKRLAAERKARGEVPGFMKKKAKG
jgi:hypothetical protein